MAREQLTDLDMNGNAITGLPLSPSASTDAVSKSYVDSFDNLVTLSLTQINARLAENEIMHWMGY